MAGGMAGGSVVGVVLEPVVSWQGLFLGVATFSLISLLCLLPYRALLGNRRRQSRAAASGHDLRWIWELLRTARGHRAYGYVFLNAVFHSGVFTWLGVYFSHRYGVGEVGIGLALLGYSVPALFGPTNGRLADRFGRSRLIPLGLFLAGAEPGGLVVRHSDCSGTVLGNATVARLRPYPAFACGHRDGSRTAARPGRGPSWHSFCCWIRHRQFGFWRHATAWHRSPCVIFGGGAILAGAFTLILFNGEGPQLLDWRKSYLMIERPDRFQGQLQPSPVLSAKRQTRRAHGAEEKVRIWAAFATIAGVGALLPARDFKSAQRCCN